MTKREKLIARIRARSADADFSDVKALLEMFGWTLDRSSGSHHTFTKDGEPSITVSTISGRTVKQYILKQICDRLGLD